MKKLVFAALLFNTVCLSMQQPVVLPSKEVLKDKLTKLGWGPVIAQTALIDELANKQKNVDQVREIVRFNMLNFIFDANGNVRNDNWILARNVLFTDHTVVAAIMVGAGQ